MPCYDFKCDDCLKDFDKFLTFKQYDEKEVVNCPSCNSQNTTLCISSNITIIDSTPKTLGTLAEKNWRNFGEATKSKKMQERDERKGRLNKVLGRKEEKRLWPKLSQKALSKMNVSNYINSDSPPKEM